MSDEPGDWESALISAGYVDGLGGEPDGAGDFLDGEQLLGGHSICSYAAAGAAAAAGSRSDTEQPTASAMSISSSTVMARSPRSLRSTDWCDIPVLAAMLALLSPALATAARTSAATWFRVVLVFMWSTIVLNEIEVNRVDQIGSKWDDLGMGRGQLTGPATAYVAGELRAERARQGLTIDERAEFSALVAEIMAPIETRIYDETIASL